MIIEIGPETCDIVYPPLVDEQNWTPLLQLLSFVKQDLYVVMNLQGCMQQLTWQWPEVDDHGSD